MSLIPDSYTWTYLHSDATGTGTTRVRSGRGVSDARERDSQVAVPQSKVQALFETLDVHDNGRVSASEWVENFQRYITEVSERRQAHHIPAEKNTVKATGSSGRPGTPSMMPYGVRGTASERTLRNTGATVAGKSAS
eukprot:CAMPEP_0177777168 /NCGR_PEP_ID=MMETSP0491_2-20121128/15167_1 /TAXON_ID=63592 /ORGANISM="Tetraselmis chuii, Strain PLY429" /LENGTH=136 /DNA_ID=CAMNT_0019296137 /DNA_START=1207 /DNA_END=1614 /DNA_ORIENTATION=+